MSIVPKEYRKKPVVIEALQWTGVNQPEVWEWAGADKFYGPIPKEDGWPAHNAKLYVAANDAWLDLEVGEWIIRNSLGFYPCKPDIFTKTYEAVE